MYVLGWRTVSALTRGYFGVYFPICEATREINTKITPEWAQKQFVTRVQTLSYFLRDITNPWTTIKTTIFTHHHRVSLALLSLCRWRHNRLLMVSQWPDNCYAITWIVISNSLDIYFIHGDIHGRSCNKIFFSLVFKVKYSVWFNSVDEYSIIIGVYYVLKVNYIITIKQ